MRKRATKEIFKLKSAFTSNSYSLNTGYNKAINQTIICNSFDCCETIKVDLGLLSMIKNVPNVFQKKSDNCLVVSDAVASNSYNIYTFSAIQDGRFHWY